MTDRDERHARIAARVAKRGRKRGFVRCLLPRRPECVAEQRLRAGAELVCGAVVFEGDQGDHLEDVHHAAHGEWEPAADVPDTMEAA